MEHEYVRGLKLCEKERRVSGPTSENHGGAEVGLGKKLGPHGAGEKAFFWRIGPEKSNLLESKERAVKSEEGTEDSLFCLAGV